MTDLIKQAEAFDARAAKDELTAKVNEDLAQAYREAADWNRAQAAELRRQAAERPLRLWVNTGGEMLAAGYPSEAEAKYRARGCTRVAVPMIEVKPVRVTSACLSVAAHNFSVNSHHRVKAIRAVIDYTIREICGLEVES